jgi:cell division protein FtsB
MVSPEQQAQQISSRRTDIQRNIDQLNSGENAAGIIK